MLSEGLELFDESSCFSSSSFLFSLDPRHAQRRALALHHVILPG